MNPGSIVIRRASTGSGSLVLLFHGVGGRPDNLLALGQRIADAIPDGTVVSVAGPHPSPAAGGREWFGVNGITEQNRPERVAGAMQGFVADIRGWQQAVDATMDATVLVGFSQGGMMSLEASVRPSFPAARVIAMGSRFASLPERAPAQETRIHLLHGQDDTVIPCGHAIDGASRLRSFGVEVTLDVLAATGHRISAEMADRAVDRLLDRV